MYQRKIMVDVDDTISDFWAIMLPLLREQTRKYHVQLSDFTNYDSVLREFGIKQHQFLGLCKEVFHMLPPRKRMIEKINDLSNTYEIVIATARSFDDNAYNKTADWLEDHGVAYDRLHITDRPKHEFFAGEKPFQFIFEDKLETVRSFLDHNMTNNAVMVVAPWNEHGVDDLKTQYMNRFHPVTEDGEIT